MIGIFDSGIGGMTVARAIENSLPNVRLLYLGDLARTPYGSKSDNAILEYSMEISRFLVQEGARLIVIACNSAASVATQHLRRELNIPVVEVITPAVERALASTRNGRLGVIGTSATIRNNIYEQVIRGNRPDYKVFSQACPLLVPLVEEGWFNKRETKMIIRRYLHPLKDKQIDTLVLGCTHYPLLRHLIQPRIGKRVKLIDSAEAVASYLKIFLQKNPELLTINENRLENRYFVTDITETVQTTANSIFQRNIELIAA